MGTEEGCHLPPWPGALPGLTGGSAAARAGMLCGSWVSVPHLFIELNAIQIELSRAPRPWSVCTSQVGMLLVQMHTFQHTLPAVRRRWAWEQY